MTMVSIGPSPNVNGCVNDSQLAFVQGPVQDKLVAGASVGIAFGRFSPLNPRFSAFLPGLGFQWGLEAHRRLAGNTMLQG